MIFSDWRKSDVAPINLNLSKDKIYSFSAQSVGLKGYLGGTHTWYGFWSNEHRQWLVIELTDLESLQIQKAKVVYKKTDEFLKLAPFIVARDPRGRWFGATPRIVDECIGTLEISDLINFCRQYPFEDYKLLSQNCNSFSSFLNYQFNKYYNYDFEKPAVVVGYKKAEVWQRILNDSPELAARSYEFNTQEMRASL